MSELKAFDSERIYWAVEQVEREAGDINSLHLDDSLFYLKSEADKVIAENDEELRHSNYKRCLDKAEMCEARYDEEDAKVNGCGASWEYISNKMKYWERWRRRWLELAEKFKEVK